MISILTTPVMWGALSVACTLLSLVPYIYLMLKGRIKPHIFTWFIWSFTACVACLVQVTHGAGPGAWAAGVTASFCIVIVILSLRWGEKTITSSDKISLIAAIMVVPLWLLTQNPSLAAIWVTLIDTMGYYPTWRKSWHKPREEMAWSRFLSVLKHGLTLLALENVSVATAVYSSTLIVLNAATIILIFSRRRVMSRLILNSNGPNSPSHPKP